MSQRPHTHRSVSLLSSVGCLFGFVFVAVLSHAAAADRRCAGVGIPNEPKLSRKTRRLQTSWCPACADPHCSTCTNNYQICTECDQANGYILVNDRCVLSSSSANSNLFIGLDYFDVTLRQVVVYLARLPTVDEQNSGFFLRTREKESDLWSCGATDAVVYDAKIATLTAEVPVSASQTQLGLRTASATTASATTTLPTLSAPVSLPRLPVGLLFALLLPLCVSAAVPPVVSTPAATGRRADRRPTAAQGTTGLRTTAEVRLLHAASGNTGLHVRAVSAGLFGGWGGGAAARTVCGLLTGASSGRGDADDAPSEGRCVLTNAIGRGGRPLECNILSNYGEDLVVIGAIICFNLLFSICYWIFKVVTGSNISTNRVIPLESIPNGDSNNQEHPSAKQDSIIQKAGPGFASRLMMVFRYQWSLLLLDGVQQEAVLLTLSSVLVETNLVSRTNFPTSSEYRFSWVSLTISSILLLFYVSQLSATLYYACSMQKTNQLAEIRPKLASIDPGSSSANILHGMEYSQNQQQQPKIPPESQSNQTSVESVHKSTIWLIDHYSVYICEGNSTFCRFYPTFRILRPFIKSLPVLLMQGDSALPYILGTIVVTDLLHLVYSLKSNIKASRFEFGVECISQSIDIALYGWTLAEYFLSDSTDQTKMWAGFVLHMMRICLAVVSVLGSCFMVIKSCCSTTPKKVSAVLPVIQPTSKAGMEPKVQFIRSVGSIMNSITSIAPTRKSSLVDRSPGNSTPQPVSEPDYLDVAVGIGDEDIRPVYAAILMLLPELEHGSRYFLRMHYRELIVGHYLKLLKKKPSASHKDNLLAVLIKFTQKVEDLVKARDKRERDSETVSDDNSDDDYSEDEEVKQYISEANQKLRKYPHKQPRRPFRRHKAGEIFQVPTAPNMMKPKKLFPEEKVISIRSLARSQVSQQASSVGGKTQPELLLEIPKMMARLPFPTLGDPDPLTRFVVRPPTPPTIPVKTTITWKDLKLLATPQNLGLLGRVAGLKAESLHLLMRMLVGPRIWDSEELGMLANQKPSKSPGKGSPEQNQPKLWMANQLPVPRHLGASELHISAYQLGVSFANFAGRNGQEMSAPTISRPKVDKVTPAIQRRKTHVPPIRQQFLKFLGYCNNKSG